MRIRISKLLLQPRRPSLKHSTVPRISSSETVWAVASKLIVFACDGQLMIRTFGLALSAVHLAKKGLKVMILVPTPQLLDLIQGHIDNLTSSSNLSIWLTTPKAALSDTRLETFSPNIIFIDEPESLLSRLPPRHLQGGALRSHPFYKHPPPLSTLLDTLARLIAKTGTETRMVWVGAELNGLLKRIVRQRGWAGMDALELDFESGDMRAKKDIASLAGSKDLGKAVKGIEENGPEDINRVEHFAYTVGPAGVIPLINEVKKDLPTFRTGRPAIDDSMIRAVVLFQQQNPSPEGTTTMILPPEGYPLDQLATRLTSLASTLNLPMSIMTTIPPPHQSDMEENSILLISRSAVPGLDIQNLSRIILINGLDLAGLSPAQRSRGGAKKRAALYDVVSGRLGRLGSVTYRNSWRGQVVSFVTEGSGEEAGLGSVKMTPKSGMESSSEKNED